MIRQATVIPLLPERSYKARIAAWNVMFHNRIRERTAAWRFATRDALCELDVQILRYVEPNKYPGSCLVGGDDNSIVESAVWTIRNYWRETLRVLIIRPELIERRVLRLAAVDERFAYQAAKTCAQRWRKTRPRQLDMTLRLATPERIHDYAAIVRAIVASIKKEPA